MLLQPEGHVVKVSLHAVVFIMITRTSVEDWKSNKVCAGISGTTATPRLARDAV